MSDEKQKPGEETSQDLSEQRNPDGTLKSQLQGNKDTPVKSWGLELPEAHTVKGTLESLREAKNLGEVINVTRQLVTENVRMGNSLNYATNVKIYRTASETCGNINETEWAAKFLFLAQETENNGRQEEVSAYLAREIGNLKEILTRNKQ